MGSAKRSKLAAVLLLCVALLSFRTLADHLHFCFDGTEPLMSIHGDDGEIHHVGAVFDVAHDDLDLDLMSALFKSGVNLLPIALLGALLVLLLPLTRVQWSAFPASLIPDSRFRFLRPPMRGPPR